jgi:hypothetical protein
MPTANRTWRKMYRPLWATVIDENKTECICQLPFIRVRGRFNLADWLIIDSIENTIFRIAENNHVEPEMKSEIKDVN